MKIFGKICYHRWKWTPEYNLLQLTEEFDKYCKSVEGSLFNDVNVDINVDVRKIEHNRVFMCKSCGKVTEATKREFKEAEHLRVCDSGFFKVIGDGGIAFDYSVKMKGDIGDYLRKAKKNVRKGRDFHHW